jgi:polysaccharide export outer membrane protein
MFMRGSLITFALVLGAVHFPACAQGVPKELVQYVRDAQKAGIKTPQIRQNALVAGWPEGTVDQAIGSVGDSPKTEATAPSNAAKMVAPKEIPQEQPSSAAAPATSEAPATAANDPAGAKIAAPDARPAGAPETAAPPIGTPTTDPGGVKAKAPAEGIRGDDYLIGEGDVLQISVYGEPTASVLAATVRPDGKVSMPLVKDVLVAGMTPAKVEAALQEQLAKSIKAPDVTVIVSQINSKKIFMTGAVKREGPLKYTYRMTVLQAISEAGGLSDYAKRKKIYILHYENGRQYRLPFDYIAVLKGEHMEENILLSPGDTIVVP